MKKLFLLPATAACIGAIFAAGCPASNPSTSNNPTPTPKAAKDLVAYKTTNAPTLDGKLDEAAWKTAEAATIKVYGGDNGSAQTVTMKALYDSEFAYFGIEVPDPTKSIRRMPYVKGADGNWTKVSPTEDYEDKFSILWDMGVEGFKEQGCAVTCHLTTAGRDRALKYTNKAGEKVDMWHVKNGRNSVVGYVDDQYTDNDTTSASAGRKTDPTASGKAYTDIPLKTIDGKQVPDFTAAADFLTGDKRWVIDLRNTATISVDNSQYTTGAELPSIAVNSYTGDSADLPGKFIYDETGKKWTYEFKRKLNTGSTNDIQWTDLKKSYAFGVAIFDNTQIGHGTQKDVSFLTFKE